MVYNAKSSMGRSINLKHAENEFKGAAGFMLLASVLLQLLLSSLVFSFPIYSTEIASYFDTPSKGVAVLGIVQVIISLSGTKHFVLFFLHSVWFT